MAQPGAVVMGGDEFLQLLVEEGTEDHIPFTCCLLNHFTARYHLGVSWCPDCQLVEVTQLL